MSESGQQQQQQQQSETKDLEFHSRSKIFLPILKILLFEYLAAYLKILVFKNLKNILIKHLFRAMLDRVRWVRPHLLKLGNWCATLFLRNWNRHLEPKITEIHAWHQIHVLPYT